MEYGDSPYVKCVGFLYMRYCSDPSALWNKLSKYMYIDEKFCPSLDQENIVGEGEYVENLFTELNYYGTRLPRIPIMIEREIKKKIMIHHEKKLRRAENLKILAKFRPGKEVRVHSTDQRIRNGIIESIEGKLVKVNYARCNNNQNSVDLDGFKQLEKLEELFNAGETVAEEVQEEFVPLQDLELLNPDLEPEGQDASAGAQNSTFKDIYKVHEKNHRMKGVTDDRLNYDMNAKLRVSGSRDGGRSHRKKRAQHGTKPNGRASRKNHRASSSSSSDRSIPSASKASKSRDRGRNKRSRSRDRGRTRRVDRSRSRKRSRKDDYRTRRDRKDADRKARAKKSSGRRKKYSSSSGNSSSDSSKSKSANPKKLKGVEMAEPTTEKNSFVKQNDRYLEEIKRKERESALSYSKADYARRPTSYKASLSNPIVNHGGKKGAW